MVKYWNMVARHTVVPLSLEIFKTQMDNTLSNLISVDLFRFGLGLYHSQMPLSDLNYSRILLVKNYDKAA